MERTLQLVDDQREPVHKPVHDTPGGEENLPLTSNNDKDLAVDKRKFGR